MMKSNARKKHFWILGLLMAIALTLMTGCVTESAGNGNDDYTSTPQETPAAAADIGNTAPDAENVTVPPPFEEDFVVARVNGIDVYVSDVSFLVMQAEMALMWEYFEMFDDFNIDREREFRDGLTFDEVLRQEMVEIAAFTKIFEDMARQLGITLSNDDIEMIDDHVDMLVEQHGRDELENLLRTDGFRDLQHLVDYFNSQMILENLVQAIMDDPAEFARFEQHLPEEEEMPEEELLGAKHILANFDNFDDPNEAYIFASELLTRVNAGEDFATLMAEYGQDPGMVMSPDGYTFVSGVMVPEFEEATRDLAIGETSGLVRSQFGYHIILRTEPNENDVMRPQWMPQPRTLEDRMIEAIIMGLREMVEEADIEILPAMDDVYLGSDSWMSNDDEE